MTSSRGRSTATRDWSSSRLTHRRCCGRRSDSSLSTPISARFQNGGGGPGGRTWKVLQILKAWVYLLLSGSGRLLRVIWL